MTAILHRLALGLAVAAFAVVVVSSYSAGASPMSIISRGVAAFVLFGVFGIVALRGVVYNVIGELARQAEEKRHKEQTEEQVEQEPEADVPFPE